MGEAQNSAVHWVDQQTERQSKQVCTLSGFSHPQKSLFHKLNQWENLPVCLRNTSVQFSRSVMSDSLLPCDCGTPGLPVQHELPELTQTHVHWVGNAIQPSHPLSSLSPPTLSLSQHQGLFKWVSSSHQVAKVLELQQQSFQRMFRTDLL